MKRRRINLPENDTYSLYSQKYYETSLTYNSTYGQWVVSDPSERWKTPEQELKEERNRKLGSIL